MMLMIAAAAAQPTEGVGRCVTRPEAEAIALVALPSIIRQTGVLCAAKLPTTSLVRRTDGPFLARYDAAADRAWPAAKAAITRLGGDALRGLLDSVYARSMLGTIAAPLVVGRIAVADCATIDRLVVGLAPLPPTNTASVVVTALGYLNAERRKGKAVEVPDLPLCPGGG